MLEIKNNGSFDFAIDTLNLGYWSDTKGSCIYFKNSYLRMGDDVGGFYLNLRIKIGRVSVKIDI